MKLNDIVVSLAVSLFIGVSSHAMAATIINDGDFSIPSIGAYESFGVNQSSSSFGSWNVTSGNVDLIGTYWNSATLGGGSVDLDGFQPGAIQQSFAAKAGSYVLKFFLSGNPDAGTGVKLVNVSVGNTSKTFSFTTGTNNHMNMGYLPETLAFQTTGSPNFLTFASLDGAASTAGAVISGVSVSTVPLPAALPLFGTAVAGLVGFAKRRKNTNLST